MARFSRLETLTTRSSTAGWCRCSTTRTPAVAKKIVEAVADGGCRVAEMTNRGDRAYRVFQELEEHFAKARPEMILGVGSIVDAPTAALYIAQGANFIVGPTTLRGDGDSATAGRFPYAPGCGSATEIQDAHDLGCEIVKVFPGAEVGGPSFVKAVLGPCPWTRIMPTGGVDATEESVTEWIKAGAAALGIGGNLITKELLAAKDYPGISAKVKQVMAWIQKARAGKK